jgi:hypothetical protein
MKVTILVTLPVPGSGCDDIRVTGLGADLQAEYQYGEGGTQTVGALMFDWAIAYRFHDEKHARGFDSKSYDALVEIEESPWLRELGETSGKWRHFAVFFSNIGYVEVAAREFKQLPDRAGTLS